MVQKHSRHLTWDGIEAILLVARHGTVRAAAAEIDVAHTTLAHRIKVAERAMGVSAFVKSVRGYTLTDEGAQIVTHAERMAGEADALNQFLTDSRQEAIGPVTVSMNASLLSYVAAGALDLLQANHPGVSINFSLGDGFADLDRRESDIVLRLQDAPQPTLFGRRLCQVRSAVYTTRRTAEAFRTLDGPIPVVGWAEAAKVAPVYASLGLEHVQVVATVSDIQAQRALALSAAVAAELPCYIGDPDPDLVRLAPGRLRDLNALWILTHRSLRSSPRIAAVFEALAATALRKKALLEGADDAGLPDR